MAATNALLAFGGMTQCGFRRSRPGVPIEQFVTKLKTAFTSLQDTRPRTEDGARDQGSSGYAHSVRRRLSTSCSGLIPNSSTSAFRPMKPFCAIRSRAKKLKSSKTSSDLEIERMTKAQEGRRRVAARRRTFLLTARARLCMDHGTALRASSGTGRWLVWMYSTDLVVRVVRVLRLEYIFIRYHF